MRQPLVAWLAAGLFTVSSAAFGQSAFDGRVKVGVLNDQSSLYADATGQGSVVAAQMAAQDYMEANPNSKLKIEITFADHQNKPDIGANIARQWFEREGVDMILDVPNSSVALAVQRRRAAAQQGDGQRLGAAPRGSPATNVARTRCIGRSTITRSPTAPAGAVVATGGDTWFFITADYAFGHDLEAETAAVVNAMGGKVLGSVRASLKYPGFFLVSAAGAELQGEGDRACQCRRRHHQLDQAGVRVRPVKGGQTLGRPVGVHHRHPLARARRRLRACNSPRRSTGT